jgi:hypothetical protein
VLSNAVHPGWVPTRMGGPGASDNLTLGHRTQEWLAVSDDPDARTTGGYWHHQTRLEPHPACRDTRFQDERCGPSAPAPHPPSPTDPYARAQPGFDPNSLALLPMSPLPRRPQPLRRIPHVRPIRPDPAATPPITRPTRRTQIRLVIPPPTILRTDDVIHLRRSQRAARTPDLTQPTVPLQHHQTNPPPRHRVVEHLPRSVHITPHSPQSGRPRVFRTAAFVMLLCCVLPVQVLVVHLVWGSVAEP